MENAAAQVKGWVDREYRWGFVSPVAADTLPKGLTEEIIRTLSALKPERDFLLARPPNA